MKSELDNSNEEFFKTKREKESNRARLTLETGSGKGLAGVNYFFELRILWIVDVNVEECEVEKSMKWKCQFENGKFFFPSV